MIKGYDSPRAEALVAEAQQQRKGGRRSPIPISNEWAVLNWNGEELNLAFRLSAQQGGKNRACGGHSHSLTNQAFGVLAQFKLASWRYVAEITN